tara:strand:+ start:1668 stop:2924 length:1257 start_codon:yes stop_codon:yes gene_type:complete
MKHDRATLFDNAFRITEEARKENRDLTNDEEAKVDRMFDDADAMSERIKQEENEQRTSRMSALQSEISKPSKSSGPVLSEDRNITQGEYKERYTRAFTAWIRNDATTEQRVMTTGSATGGAAAIPTDMVSYIIDRLYQTNVMRQICTLRMSGADTKIPIAGASVTGAAVVSENVATTPADLNVANVTAEAYERRPAVQISNALLADSSFNMANHIAESLARQVAIGEETDFVQSTGNPLGTTLSDCPILGLGTHLVKIADDGDITPTAGAAITNALVWDTYHSIDAQYRNNSTSRWLVGDAFLKEIRKLTTAATVGSTPLWMPGELVASGSSGATICGVPYAVTPALPHACDPTAVTADNVNAIFGDFSFAEIWQRTGMSLMQDPYTESLKGNVQFIGSLRSDIVFTNNEAFNFFSKN